MHILAGAILFPAMKALIRYSEDGDLEIGRVDSRMFYYILCAYSLIVFYLMQHEL
jgi:hypothetical protein